ncbi:lamin tail domain-containing protein [Tenacibaculum sp. IB213877]|uniref:lamin tail domain-containing protein n=1 Tax=Tenacibaculum sp. IB213877 TaxID=3097351 RepID=UPI002A5ABE9B|nr:lamin tail domain-containing protein [Tenacibaculum sp. IB213877]MDY0780101.1 lamin tail domain-containing protein [Tenacibaculum sp. IB213877]
MKNNYFFKILGFIITFTFSNLYSQGLEDFTNSNATSSYASNSFIGNNGITWTYTASRDGNNDANGVGINLPALMLRRVSDNSNIKSDLIPGGIGNFSVKLYKGFTGAGNRQVELFINDISYGTSIAFDDADDKDFYIFTVDNINVLGNFTLEIRNITGSQVIIDDITWTGFTTTNPTVGFDAVSSSESETNTTFNTTIPVSFTNYNADVTISITVDGTSTAESGDYTLNTTSLTFTGNGTQNILLDINNDTDFESETLLLNLAVTSGIADISITQHTITISDDDIPIVINEIHADPDATNGDANGDGVVDTTDDEFVEVYNISGIDLDISGWMLSDAISIRHTFPSGTIIPANQTIVVFGGGTPTTVPGLVQTSSSGALNLNNAGDTVTIKDSMGSSVLVEVYGAAGNNQAIARDDDFTGAFVDHSTITSNPVLFSPGRYNTDNTAFSGDFIWSGSTNNDWNTTTNWLHNVLPIDVDNVIIPNGLTNYPSVSSATTVNSVTIESGASLIANATLTGDVTYTRNLPTTNWYLISSPVNGETIENFISGHNLAAGTGSNLGLASFSNNGTSPWNYVDAATTEPFVTGQGYSVKLASASDISFTGNINSSDVSYAIATGDRNNFTLVGNPFTAFVNSATFASDNTSLLTEETIWIWDGTQYITKNAADPIELAPGQGFFVEAITNGSLNFATTNQSHQATDTFMRQTPNPEIELVVESETDKKSAKIFYIDGKSTDFDNGYDGSLFSGADTNFAVFTELVSNNQGEKLAIQSLPNADYETMVIPIGLITDAGKEVSFTINTENLPNGLDVYLEDRLNNEFINLSETNYDVVIENQTNNSGQFYLHTTSQRLSTENIKTDASVGVYKSSKSEITISGINEKVKIRVYSVLGNEIINTEVNSNGYSKVNLPSLSSGLYIIKVESDSHKLTKKIIL